MASQSFASIHYQWAEYIAARLITCLLFVAFLGHQRKGHGIHWRRGGCRPFVLASVAASRLRSLRASYGHRDIEHVFSLKFARVQTIRHHLLKFSVKLSFGLRITLFFLAGDNNVFLEVRVTLRIFVSRWLLKQISM